VVCGHLVNDLEYCGVAIHVPCGTLTADWSRPLYSLFKNILLTSGEGDQVFISAMNVKGRFSLPSLLLVGRVVLIQLVDSKLRLDLGVGCVWTVIILWVQVCMWALDHCENQVRTDVMFALVLVPPKAITRLSGHGLPICGTSSPRVACMNSGDTEVQCRDDWV
jgi:hypothetical protein